MRVLGVDLGEKRVGLAISDVSRTLARPLTTLRIQGGVDAIVGALGAELHRLQQEEAVSLIVVGLPKRLDGTEHARSVWTRRVADRLTSELGLPVALQDERLSSHEAESRLAERERDWRRRKDKLDAAAAAVILQDYLDHR